MQVSGASILDSSTDLGNGAEAEMDAKRSRADLIRHLDAACHASLAPCVSLTARTSAWVAAGDDGVFREHGMQGFMFVPDGSEADQSSSDIVAGCVSRTKHGVVDLLLVAGSRTGVDGSCAETNVTCRARGCSIGVSATAHLRFGDRGVDGGGMDFRSCESALTLRLEDVRLSATGDSGAKIVARNI
jgi:hypothetical protein